jgi:hypothetical protein
VVPMDGDNAVYRVRAATSPATRALAVSAKGFGAVGDGLADDTEALQLGLDTVL